jgi:hypothetical protein
MTTDTDGMRFVLQIIYNIYSIFKEHANALRVTLKIDNLLFIQQTFFNFNNYNKQKQLAFIFVKQKIYLTKTCD